MDKMDNSMISFIIPAYNEELLLGRTLKALHNAARALGEPFEIVVADDASTDRTAVVARQHGARVVSVSYRQIAATRNAGIRAANGELFVFVDAEVTVARSSSRTGPSEARLPQRLRTGPASPMECISANSS
jgi:glycosyltransferase involved in cell wall biosynthesis